MNDYRITYETYDKVEAWSKCWLNYTPINNSEDAEYFESLYIDGFGSGNVLVSDDDNPSIQAVHDELTIAAKKLFGIELTKVSDCPKKGIIVKEYFGSDLGSEGYRIKKENSHITIEGPSTAAIVYATFRLISLVRIGGLKEGVAVTEVPKNPIRMLDHWDNMDGSIERGYSGKSFFFENDEIIINQRTVDYARMIASLGINAVAINNVNVKNAATDLVNWNYIKKVAILADIFGKYGIKLFLSLNYAMPIEYEPASADPLDEKVIHWWEEKMTYVYENIPNLGGFLVKADSEGRPGPFTYGRNQADGANMLARAIAPHGGIIIWRCFVYNCQQDWRDLTIDRARAGYDYFSSLDGQFEDNVILQIKNGPMDFQVREPISPLFGGLRATNQMLEVQIAQEYTGHQIDVCYLIPWFKQILAFETYMNNDPDCDTTVAGIISGRAGNSKIGGMVAVTNTGNDYNWTGNDLAAANLYGFGRLAWDTELSAEEIAEEWIKLTFAGLDTESENVIEDILMKSWPAYEKYTSPLGIGWMVTPHDHYGPSVDGYEYDRWGTYHRADWQGLGVERGPEGTGFALQYNSPNKENYSNPETTPEELLLFFHKMPYKHVLSTGKTIIQHIYDTHFEGYETAKEMQKAWNSLEGKIKTREFEETKKRFAMQERNAREWCDIVNSYFYRKCGIADEKGRTIY